MLYTRSYIKKHLTSQKDPKKYQLLCPSKFKDPKPTLTPRMIIPGHTPTSLVNSPTVLITSWLCQGPLPRQPLDDCCWRSTSQQTFDHQNRSLVMNSEFKHHHEIHHHHHHDSCWWHPQHHQSFTNIDQVTMAEPGEPSTVLGPSKGVAAHC